MADTFYKGPHETFSQMTPTDQSDHDTVTWSLLEKIKVK
jgi:hypothetical protein